MLQLRQMQAPQSVARPWVRGFIAGVAGMIAIQVLLYVFGPKALFRPVSARSQNASEIRPNGLDEVRVGPWGILEARRIPLMAPGHLLPDGPERLAEPKWFFESFTAKDLR